MVTTTYNQSLNTTAEPSIAQADILKDTPAGSMSIDVSKEQEFTPGMEIVIAPDTPLAEFNKVRAVGTIDLETPTKNAHKAGTKVVQKTTETTIAAGPCGPVTTVTTTPLVNPC